MYVVDEFDSVFNDLNLFQFLITNLTKGTLYEVKLQGATRSVKDLNKLYRGDFSESRKVILQSKCISKSIFSIFPCLTFLIIN